MKLHTPLTRPIVFAIMLCLSAFIKVHAQTDNEEICFNDSTLYLEVVEKKPSFQRNFFVEFGGPSLSVFGLGFDSRFKPGSPFGYRAGMAYVDGSLSIGDYPTLDFKGVNLPLELNAIFGKHKSKFEIGIGMVPSILHRARWSYEYEIIKTEYNYYDYNIISHRHDEGTRINITGLMNIGYRYQRDSGFFMRVGLTLMLGDLKCSPVDGLMLMPNIAFGYTIR